MDSGNKSINKLKQGDDEDKMVTAALIITVILILIFMLFSKIYTPAEPAEIESLVVGQWGDPGDINLPYGISTSPDDEYIYVASMGDDEIRKFRQSPKRRWVLERKWGGTGSGQGQLDQPSGLATDKDGNVYVADSHNGSIKKFGKDGDFISEINLAKTLFWRPRNVMIDNAGTIYVANTGKANLYHFTSDGRMADDYMKFSGEIFGLAVDSNGKIYVASLGDRAVVILDQSFKRLRKVKIESWIPNRGLSPMIAIDSQDRLYAVSELESLIYVFDVKNEKPALVGALKNDTKGRAMFYHPLGIAVDSQDYLYVTDRDKNRMIKFRPVFKQNK